MMAALDPGATVVNAISPRGTFERLMSRDCRHLNLPVLGMLVIHLRSIQAIKLEKVASRGLVVRCPDLSRIAADGAEAVAES